MIFISGRFNPTVCRVKEYKMSLSSDPDVEYHHYPKLDEEETALIEAANEGCLETVKKLVHQVPIYDKCELINESPIRTENEDKWFSATPLLAAAKAGNVEVTEFLLGEGADPSLVCSPLPGVQETALSAARNNLRQLRRTLRGIAAAEHHVYERDVWTDSEAAVLALLLRYRGLLACVRLLRAAGRHWTRSAYRAAEWSQHRQTVHRVGGRPNTPASRPALVSELRSARIRSERQAVTSASIYRKLIRGYNKVLLERRCEELQRRVEGARPGRKKASITQQLQKQRGQERSPVIRIPRRYRGQ